jgi:phage internal scaffolding protein
MTKVKFKTAYGVKERSSFETTGPSLTQQHFKDEVDIKNTIRRYDRTGLIANVNKAVAQYGDFTASVNEYQDALNLVIAAQQNFAALPAEIREMFGNNPGEFLEQVQNPENRDRMMELGLIERPQPKVEVLNETEKAAAPPAPQKAGE